jgi:hypothetical protein
VTNPPIGSLESEARDACRRVAPHARGRRGLPIAPKARAAQADPRASFAGSMRVNPDGSLSSPGASGAAALSPVYGCDLSKKRHLHAMFGVFRDQVTTGLNPADPATLETGARQPVYTPPSDPRTTLIGARGVGAGPAATAALCAGSNAAP